MNTSGGVSDRGGGGGGGGEGGYRELSDYLIAEDGLKPAIAQQIIRHLHAFFGIDVIINLC
jgi:hypothetical protein